MENATKALLMAAGVLIGIMVLAALLLMVNNINNYRKTETQNTREAQIQEFNNQYATYDRNDVRGSDIISLANKVADYNQREVESNGYQPMELTIDLNKSQSKNKIPYKNGEWKLFTQSTYTESNNETQFQNNVMNNAGGVKKIEKTYAQIKKLTENISNIESLNQNDEIPQKLTELGVTKSNINNIKDAVIKYYEYTQFNKSYFDCVGREYDKNTGRILKLNFKYVRTGI